MRYRAPDAPAIVAYARTPFTLPGGGLSKLNPVDFSAQCVQQLVCRSGVSPEDVTDFVVGNVLQAGLGQLPAKQIAMRAGLPTSVVCSSVNMVCSSGMSAIIEAARLVSAEPERVVIAGGFEAMSQTPFASLSSARGSTLPRFGLSGAVQAPSNLPLVDLLAKDGLSDAPSGLPMGCVAEMCAHMDGIGRELQDVYCVASYKRAMAAQSRGLLKEITPIVPYDIPDDVSLDNIRVEERKLGSCGGGHVSVESPAQVKDEKRYTFRRIVTGSIGRFAHSPKAVVTVKQGDVIELDEAPSKLDESKVYGLKGCFNGWANNLEDYKIDTSEYGPTIDGDRMYREYLSRSKMNGTQINTTSTTDNKLLFEPNTNTKTKDLSSTHTAANSSKISDGAAFVLVVSQDYYKRHKEQILANSEYHEAPIFIEGFTSIGTHPSLFPIAPSKAIERLLRETSVPLDDIAHVEINEAFSSIAVNNALRIGLTMDDIFNPSSKRFNASGGGVSIGHPLGASGARLLVTLCRQLNEDLSIPSIITPSTAEQMQRKSFRGLAAICNGGGGACAVMLRT